MTTSLTPTGAGDAAVFAWSKRVRRIGGFIQVAFAAFWLVRGSLNIHGPLGKVRPRDGGTCATADER
jgi:hypothetical protein